MTNSYSTKGTPSLEQLTNTSIENPVNDEVLTYENGLWKNSTASSPTSTFAGCRISQPITSTAETNITDWTSQVHTGITFVDGFRAFTTPTAGWYSLSFSLEVQGAPTVFTYSILRIKKNNSNIHALQNDDYSAVGDRDYSRCLGGSFLVYMEPADYITFSSQANSSSYLVSGYCSLVKVD